MAESMLAAVDVALPAATWLTDADRGTVELLRRLAERLDHPDFPVIDGKFDNVSESLFLRTAAALGLTPDTRTAWEKKDKKNDGGGTIAKLRKGTAPLRAV